MAEKFLKNLASQLREADAGHDGYDEFKAQFFDVLRPLANAISWGYTFSAVSIRSFIKRLSSELGEEVPAFDNALSVFLTPAGYVPGEGSPRSPSSQLSSLYKWIEKTVGVDRFMGALKKIAEDSLAPFEEAQSAPPESKAGDPDPIFGKYLFASDRAGEVPPEKNTPAEDRVYDDLEGHVFNNEPMGQESALALMSTLEDGAYSTILHEPRSEVLYRGISLSKDDLEKMTGDAYSAKGSKVINRLVSNPQGEGSSSWSTDFESARTFSTSQLSRPFSVILVAKVSDNPDTFLEGPGGFYKLKKFKSFSSENESIALGPVRVYKVYWQMNRAGHNFDKRLDESMDDLRNFVRGVVSEDLKNIGGRHEKTVAGSVVLRKMHDAPGVLEALTAVDDPKELVHVIEAIIDASAVVRRDEVLRALQKVARHERGTHKR